MQPITMWKAQLWEAGAGHFCRRQEAKRDKCWCTPHSLLFLQSGSPAHGMVPRSCRMELSTSINPNQDPPKQTRLDICPLGNSRPCEVGHWLSHKPSAFLALWFLPSSKLAATCLPASLLMPSISFLDSNCPVSLFQMRVSGGGGRSLSFFSFCYDKMP